MAHAVEAEHGKLILAGSSAVMDSGHDGRAKSSLAVPDMGSGALLRAPPPAVIIPNSASSSPLSSPSALHHVAHRLHAAPAKHASFITLGTGAQAQHLAHHTTSASQERKQDKSVSRTISTYFKSLFSTKASADGGPESSSKSTSALPVGYFDSVDSPRLPMKSPLANSKSFTQQIEGEVAAAMKRAQSITGKQHAPSTLLAVCADLPPKMQRPVWNLRDYAVVEKLYTGYASNVYKAFCKLSGEAVCLKSYSLCNVCELNRFQIFREVKLHSSLSHDNIIKLYGAFQQADQVVLVQEYAESGDLFNLLQRYGGRLPERTAVELVLYPFLCVINYLHSNGIAHRDIKPENILFTADMRLKLCDFGLAINMRDERAVTRAGTLEYMAPEVLQCPFKNKPEENKDAHQLHYSFHVDTWAAGVLTYELLVGMPPFSDKHRNLVEDKIRLEVPRFPSKMSDLAKSFITQALEKDPLERPVVMDMLNHRWIRTLRRSASVRQLMPTSSVKSNNSKEHSTVLQPSSSVTTSMPVSAASSATLYSSASHMTTADDASLMYTADSLASMTFGSPSVDRGYKKVVSFSKSQGKQS